MTGERNTGRGDHGGHLAAGELREPEQEGGVRERVVDRSHQFGTAAHGDDLARRNRRDEAAHRRRDEDPPPEEEDHLVEGRVEQEEREVRLLGGAQERLPIRGGAEDVGEGAGRDRPRQEAAPQGGGAFRHGAAG